MRATTFILSAALLVVGGWLVYELRARPAPQSVAIQAAPPVNEPPAVASRPLPPPLPDARPAIRKAVAVEVAPVTTERDVDLYLADLEARARRNRQVTALEVEPALAAIRKLTPQIGFERAQELEAAYAQKMAQLSAQLDGRPLPEAITHN